MKRTKKQQKEYQKFLEDQVKEHGVTNIKELQEFLDKNPDAMAYFDRVVTVMQW